MKTFVSELTDACVSAHADEGAEDALDCYDENHSVLGDRLFEACPPQPGKALVAAVVAKHGAK